MRMFSARFPLRVFALPAVLAAIFAAPIQTAHAQPAPAPLRVAIVGLEHGHVDGFLSAVAKRKDVELVGIADMDPALLEKYRKQFGLAETLLYRTESNMIERTHPQAVLVYTPVNEHRHAIEIAAQMGVSAMVEKPLATSLADAEAIRRVARDYKTTVLVNYETTWYPTLGAAAREVGPGGIGELRRMVFMDGHQGPKEIGVPSEFLNWLTDPEKNGAGALFDFGCYGADLATWLMHGQRPLSVTAVVNHDKPQLYARVDDDATLILKYPRTQVVIEASWNWPFSRKDMEFYGTTGYAIATGADKLRVRHEHDSEERTATATAPDAARRDSLNYLKAVLEGKIEAKGDPSSLDTNLVVMQILESARESARTGRTVELHGGED